MCLLLIGCLRGRENNNEVTVTWPSGKETVTHGNWEMDDDGKSNIKGGNKLDDDKDTKEITQEEYNINREAADVCPVNVIHIINKDTNEKLI